MKMRERRAHFRKGLHALYLPIYDSLCKELPPEWQPYYGFREFEEQEHLYDLGRVLPGKIVTNARGGESAHNYGCASDWTLWSADGQPLWPSPSSPEWKVFAAACKKAKARWGGNFSSPDCPHVELALKVSYKLVRPVFVEQGFLGAMRYIRENLA